MNGVIVSHPPVSTDRPTTPIRILTQNCCLLPTYVFQSKGVDNRRQRAQLIAQMIERYDIILLQEVLGSGWCREWREIYASPPPHLQSVMSIRGKGKLIDSGLILLSRYPIRSACFTRFKSKSITNCLIDRGFLYAELQTPTGPLHVVNTHLNPDETHYGIHSPAEYRRRQMAEILKFKKERQRDGESWVIGGDFNDSALVLPAEWRISLRSQGSPPTCHREVDYAIAGEGPCHCIDYLVSNRDQVYSRVIHNLISDHYGVEIGL